MEGECLGLCAEQCVTLRHAVQYFIQGKSDKMYESCWDSGFPCMYFCALLSLYALYTSDVVCVFNLRK